jgi:hypothetical protein
MNKAVWAFLQKHRLEADPKYHEYAINTQRQGETE